MFRNYASIGLFDLVIIKLSLCHDISTAREINNKGFISNNSLNSLKLNKAILSTLNINNSI